MLWKLQKLFRHIGKPHVLGLRLREKCPYSEFFRSAFSRIRTNYWPENGRFLRSVTLLTLACIMLKRPHYTLKVLRWGCQKIFKVSLVTFYIMLEKIKDDPRGLDPFLFVIRVRSHTLVRNNSTGACNMNSYIRRFILFEINGKVFPFLLF